MKIKPAILGIGLSVVLQVGASSHAATISSSGTKSNANLGVELAKQSLVCMVLETDDAVILSVQQELKGSDYSLNEVILQTDFESEFQKVPLICQGIETVNNAGRVTSLNCRSALAKNQSCFLLRRCANRIQLVAPESHVDLELALAARGCALGQ